MRYFIAGLVTMALLLTGCTSLSRHEDDQWRALRQKNVQMEQEVSATAAALLNIGPCLGNAYLGASSREKNEWMWFVVNLLTWPISPIWGIPDGITSAKNINIKETIAIHETQAGKL